MFWYFQDSEVFLVGSSGADWVLRATWVLLSKVRGIQVTYEGVRPSKMSKDNLLVKRML